MKRKTPLVLLGGCLALALLPAALPAQTSADSILSPASQPTGSISGNVSNAATGNLLEGARVEIPSLGLAALTDNTGRFVLNGVPAGTHEVVVSYIGLDPVRRQAKVVAGQRANQDFDLTTGIYQLEQFKVTGEREGDAAAITAYRNSENLKNIAATDSFGNLPNMNAGEVAIRLPGVYGELDAGGNLSGFTVRGMSSGLNSVTMDGGLMTGQGGMGRSIFVNNITAAMFEHVELIKGHTPDKGAATVLSPRTRSPASSRARPTPASRGAIAASARASS